MIETELRAGQQGPDHFAYGLGLILPVATIRFDLLLFFARHPDQVFARMELLNQVWGYQHDGYEHTVNTHINRLRSKIEPDPANRQLYDGQYHRVYKKMYRRLQPLYEEIREITGYPLRV